ncbi:hypothetical protein ANN_15478 [Periplaneta americana]|uniref:Tc1-like transposase DDE domain-containing protein n=1 Tax=Periplaneta americana TaxID=6978 RepID=A0ABQ8SHF8_PERAM|nr:hypothetical protein ANN_15478 [Periplaneta americana]
MHHNACPHATRIVDEFLYDVGLNRMAWPARSPDINLIEHVWGLLGKQVRSRLSPHSNVQQLRNILNKEWNRIHQTDIQNLIEVIIVAALLYGSESWIHRKRDENQIQAAEMKFLTAVRGYTRRDKIPNYTNKR